MGKTYFTLTGTKYYFGKEFLEPGMKVQLIKEPENEYDNEAIRVEFKSIGKIGYVANSSFTVQGESLSAGRLYDRMGKQASAKVVLVLPQGVICKVSKKSLKKN
ncbi:MAG: HIRAN domain-containing protein [Lachnospiraceae bacterium]